MKRPVVDISQGALMGVREGRVDVYRGVPYAAQPALGATGPPPWDGERDAAVAGPASLRADTAGSAALRLLTFTYPAQSEDCLTVTVWTRDRFAR